MFKKNLFKAYFIGIHLLVILLLWKVDIVDYLGKNLKLIEPEIPAEMGEEFNHKINEHLAWQNIVPDNSHFLIGDSITEQIPVGFLPRGYINLGIGNDTVNGVNYRIQFYPAINKANKVILAVGVNDLLYRSVDEVLENYKNLITGLSEVAPIYVSLILPIDTAHERYNKTTNRNNENINLINQGLIDFCSFSNSCIIIDARASLIDDDGQLSSNMHIGDGIHLSRNGYENWIREIIESTTDN